MFVADAEGQPLFVPLLKASFDIGADGGLRVAAKQRPVVPAGEWWGPSDVACMKVEPEACMVKPATDVVLIGHAYPERPGDLETTVGLRVGPVRKLVRVFGDRFWVKRSGMLTMTAPLPFEKIPLRWERAFGGWDRRSPDPTQHRCEERNPVGAGFRREWDDAEASVALPNLEQPDRLIRNLGDWPRPAGFGFVSMNWQPRRALAGTYDKAWANARMPLVPIDFDPRFFNAAPADQVVNGYLKGDEEVVVLGASASGAMRFELPGPGVPPLMIVELRGSGAKALRPVLDTLLIDAEERCVSMLWRAAMPVLDVPGDVASMQVEWDVRGLAMADHVHVARA